MKRMINVLKKDINISQTVNNGATNLLFTYQVPSKQVLTLKKFGNYTDTVGAWGTITWMIWKNGIGYYPYDTVMDQVGMSQEPRDIEPIEFEGGDLLQIYAQNLSGGNIDMGISLSYEVRDA